MGWESRRGRGAYYTRSRREGGQVVREYVGAGLVGKLAAQEDAARRQARAARRAHRAAAEREEAARDASLEELCEVSDLLATAALLLAGYRRHDRGAWRRSRGA